LKRKEFSNEENQIGDEETRERSSKRHKLDGTEEEDDKIKNESGFKDDNEADVDKVNDEDLVASKDEGKQERTQDRDHVVTKLDVISNLVKQEFDIDGNMQKDLVDMKKLNLTADYEKWNKLSGRVNESSQRLCEQLRLLLEPTMATKLKGDYRTGKRINMRRVITYIASQYRKDKIWLRRTKRSKREYQIVLAIDNSKSMQLCGDLALESLAMISKALSKLEVGQLGVTSFGDKVDHVHSMLQPFTDASGAEIVSHFTFQQDHTCIEDGMSSILGMFENARKDLAGDTDYRQLVFFISDGRFDSAMREKLQNMIRKAMQKRQFIVLLIVEDPKQESILETKQVSFKKGSMSVSQYLDDYPFPFYVVLKDMKNLPQVLADALRQWFEIVKQDDN